MVSPACSVHHVTVSGGISVVQRSQAVLSFQRETDCTCILITAGAGAAGLTLTAATTIILLEPFPNGADEAQAFSRAHRIGQTKAVQVHILYGEGSLDERLLVVRRNEGEFEGSSYASADNLSVATAPDLNGKSEKGSGRADGDRVGRSTNDFSTAVTSKKTVSQVFGL